MATNLHGQIPQILLIAQITLSPPAFYVYRLLGAAVLQLNFPLEAFFIAWCSPVVVSSPASYVYRTPSAVWGAAVFQVQCFSLSHSFLHLFRFAGMPLPPLIVCIRLVICKGVVFFPLSHSLYSSLLFRSPVRIALQTLRKRYTFFRPGFEGFLPSPPRLAAILAWLSSHIVRFYYLFPF